MSNGLQSMSPSRATRAMVGARLGLGMTMTTIITMTTPRGASG